MTLVSLKGFGMKDKRPNFLFSKTSMNLQSKILSQASVFFLLTYVVSFSVFGIHSPLTKKKVKIKNKINLFLFCRNKQNKKPSLSGFNKQQITLTEKVPFKSANVTHF